MYCCGQGGRRQGLGAGRHAGRRSRRPPRVGCPRTPPGRAADRRPPAPPPGRARPLPPCHPGHITAAAGRHWATTRRRPAHRVRSQFVQGLEVCGHRGAAQHAPHIACAHVVGGHDHAAIQGHGQRAHGGAHFGHQLAAAGVGCQVPDADVSGLIACMGRERGTRGGGGGGRGSAARVGAPPPCRYTTRAAAAGQGHVSQPAPQASPEISSPWFGCSTTAFTAALLPYSLWHPGARRSHTRTVPSSPPAQLRCNTGLSGCAGDAPGRGRRMPYGMPCLGPGWCNGCQ
jgi:hypothetical protein